MCDLDLKSGTGPRLSLAPCFAIARFTLIECCPEGKFLFASGPVIRKGITGGSGLFDSVRAESISRVCSSVWTSAAFRAYTGWDLESCRTQQGTFSSDNKVTHVVRDQEGVVLIQQHM